MPTVIYTVQPGDTLWEIGKQFNISVGDLARQNRITDANRIYVGQRLRITTPARFNLYMIRSGDTLAGIAQRFNTTVPELMRLNNITNPDMIYAGRIIKIRE